MQVRQKFEPLEAFANAAANAVNLDVLGSLGEVANKYSVFNDVSQCMYVERMQLYLFIAYE